MSLFLCSAVPIAGRFAFYAEVPPVIQFLLSNPGDKNLHGGERYNLELRLQHGAKIFNHRWMIIGQQNFSLLRWFCKHMNLWVGAKRNNVLHGANGATSI